MEADQQTAKVLSDTIRYKSFDVLRKGFKV